jgi:hypothetical protein
MGLRQVSTETKLRHMHPTANDSAGWLLSPVAEFDGLIDATDRLIGLLAVAARTGDADAAAEIADLHRRVRELDGFDKVSVRDFADELARRAAELTK